MITTPARLIIVVLVLILMATSASRIARNARENSAMGIAEGIRNELVDLRNEVDACLATRAQSEIRLQSLAQETEEMLARLDSLEALDPRGVPTEAYDTYLDQVQGYNAAVEEWELQAEDLSDLALECDSLVREHNSLAGSLQEFLVGEGILEPEAFPRESVAPGSSS